jgi:hypothetical protein
MLDGPIVKVLPGGWLVQLFTLSTLKVICTVLVSPLGAVNVAVPGPKVKFWFMQPEPIQGIGPDVTLMFPLLSAVAVSVGQVTVIAGPESGWRVNKQVNVSESPGVRDPSVV